MTSEAQSGENDPTQDRQVAKTQSVSFTDASWTEESASDDASSSSEKTSQLASVWITSVVLAFSDDRPERPCVRRGILRTHMCSVTIGLNDRAGDVF